MSQKYDENYLKKNGFLKQKQLSSTKIKNFEIILDVENQLAFASVSNKEDAQKLYKEMKYKYNLDFYWFSYNKDTCVVVYKRYGENNYFTYDPKHSQLKSRKGKEVKLGNISKKGIRSLFDNQDLVEEFYQKLWDLRENISDNIENDFSFKDKLHIAQKYIDRFIFVNFLVQKKLIARLDNKVPKSFNLVKFLQRKYQENKGKFSVFLKRLFILLDETKEEFTLEDNGHKFTIYIPYIDGGLFDFDETINNIEEKDIVFNDKNIHWNDLLGLLDNYNWLITIEDINFDEEVFDGTKDNITPEILGHIYEKFAISLEKFAKDFDKRDRKEVKKKIQEARKGKGVYYTPEEITLYISKNTIWPYVKDKINAKDDGFEAFIKKNKELHEKAFEALRNIKICDPACGSGAFLLQAAELLFVWEKRLVKELGLKLSDFELKKNIVLNNIFGVDIQPGSVEIAKLRLWLWFSSEQEVGNVKQLPNLEYNIMEGNSLIGFTSLDAKFAESNKIILKSIKELNTLKKEYKNETTSKKKHLKKAIERSIRDVRNKVNELYIYYLNDKGLNIKKKEVQVVFGEAKETKKKKNEFYREDFYNLKPFHWAVEYYDIFKNGGFDVIVGNPPYGSSLMKIEKEIFKSLYDTIDGNEGSDNSASIFIERANILIKDHNFFSFIVPNSITRVKEFQNIRRLLLENNYLYEIVDEGHPFMGVTLEMVTLFYKKTIVPDYEIHILSRRENISIKENNVKKSIFSKYQRFILYWDEFWEKVNCDCKSNFISGKRGISISGKLLKDEKDQKHKIPVLVSGKCIKKYFLDQPYFKWGSNEILKSKEAKDMFSKEILTGTRLYNLFRVIVKQKGIVVADNNVRLYFDEDIISMHQLSVILNSSLFDYIVPKYLFNYSELTMFINSVVDAVPIKVPKNKNIFEYLSKLIIKEKKAKNIKFVNFLMNLADCLVYELYLNNDISNKLTAYVNKNLSSCKNFTNFNNLTLKLSSDKNLLDMMKKLMDIKIVKKTRVSENE